MARKRARARCGLVASDTARRDEPFTQCKLLGRLTGLAEWDRFGKAKATLGTARREEPSTQCYGALAT